jgi:site-specific DNA-methyltransferase (adenine-specific)
MQAPGHRARNSLYYGDNLDVLRNHVRDESVDLVYLDPPFNSNATYNVLFKATAGGQSAAQIEAFADTWHWGGEAEAAFGAVLRNARYGDVGTMLRALRSVLRENDMMAYLAMMAVRLIELHRVLKPTGSLYLHCDPTASHYLKVLLDAVFGAEFFQNEIVWKRTSAHSDASRSYGNVTDTILYYSAGSRPSWSKPCVPLSERNIASKYTYKEPDGRLYATRDLRSPSFRPNLHYTYKGYAPHPNGWSISREKMAEYDRLGRLYFPKNQDGRIRLKLYLNETVGQPMQNLWDDIPPLNSQSQERLGYQTQKPTALLERIIKASSNPGDVVLDAFCGCGTAIHAAEKLGRQWIGIDVTHLAISLIERRLRDAFPAVAFDVRGTPQDVAGARDLAQRDKYQFQWWAVSLVDAVPYGGQKKGADGGIDGWRYMAAGRNTVARCIISVKGGDNVSVQMVRDLRGVIERERAEAGLFITLAEPTRPMREEAAKAGYFDSPFGAKQHPRLQIMTIDALLNGARPDLPPLAIEATFQRSEREDGTTRDQGVLPIVVAAGIGVAARPGKRDGGVRPTV